VQEYEGGMTVLVDLGVSEITAADSGGSDYDLLRLDCLVYAA